MCSSNWYAKSSSKGSTKDVPRRWGIVVLNSLINCIGVMTKGCNILDLENRIALMIAENSVSSWFTIISISESCSSIDCFSSKLKPWWLDFSRAISIFFRFLLRIVISFRFDTVVLKLAIVVCTTCDCCFKRLSNSFLLEFTLLIAVS